MKTLISGVLSGVLVVALSAVSQSAFAEKDYVESTDKKTGITCLSNEHKRICYGSWSLWEKFDKKTCWILNPLLTFDIKTVDECPKYHATRKEALKDFYGD